MTPTTTSWHEALAPLWRDNLALAQLLGLCPLLAVTTTLVNGAALGVASAAVIVVASTTMALLRRVLLPAARLPLALLMLAALVTVLDLFTEAVLYDLHGTLGLFIPLIVVNSGLLAHAENVASRRSVGFTFLSAFVDGDRVPVRARDARRAARDRRPRHVARRSRDARPATIAAR